MIVPTITPIEYHISLMLPAWFVAERTLLSRAWTGTITRTSPKAFLLQGYPLVQLSERCQRCDQRRGDGLPWPAGYCRLHGAALALPATVETQLGLDEWQARMQAAVARAHLQTFWVPRPPHCRILAGQIPHLP